MVVGGQLAVHEVGKDQGACRRVVLDVAGARVQSLGARRVEDARVEPALQLGEPYPLGDVGARLSRFPTVGRDDDHAVYTLGAVDRRGGGTAQDVDRRDVVGIEIGQPVDRVVLLLAVVARRLRVSARSHREQPRRNGRIAVNDAVDHEQGVRGSDHGVRAADLNLGTAARRTGVLLDVSPRDSSLERAIDRRSGHARDFRARHDRRRRRGVGPGNPGLLAGDHHRLEVKHVGVECHIGGVLTGRDLHLAPLERDAAEHQRHGAGGCRDRVAALGARHRGKRGPGDGDIDARDRVVRHGRRHAPGDLALLRRCASHTDERRQRQRE